MIDWTEPLFVALGVFGAGFITGRHLEAAKWRAKAVSGYLRESGNGLYRVTREYAKGRDDT